MHLIGTASGMVISGRSETLVVKVSDQPSRTYALRDLRSVIVMGYGVTVTVPALSGCSKFGVPVHILSGGGRPIARVFGPSMVGTAATRRAQYAADGTLPASCICVWLIISRLRNNLATVRYYAKSRRDNAMLAIQIQELTAISERNLPSLEACASEDHAQARPKVMGLEGQLGSAYWGCMAHILPADLRFQGRRYRGAEDPVNACLNYGYGILYSYVAGALDLAGLDPFAGFLHVDRSGRESLGLDLTELFRSCWIDRGVVSLLSRGWRPVMEEGRLSEASRQALAESLLGRLDNRVTHQAKWYRLQSMIVIQARMLASFLRGERSDLDVFTAPW